MGVHLEAPRLVFSRVVSGRVVVRPSEVDQSAVSQAQRDLASLGLLVGAGAAPGDAARVGAAVLVEDVPLGHEVQPAARRPDVEPACGK